MKLDPRRTAVLAAAALLALSGCKIKDDGEAQPQPEPAATATPEPEATASETPAASIIRPDVTPTPVLDLPPAPVEETVPFPQGGYELNEDARRVLARVMESDALAEGWPIVLRGHTDSEGTDSGNLIASEKRAETVAAWLVDNGVGHERIEIIALGEQRPVAPNAKLDGTPDEAGRARNRRVDIWIGPAGTNPEAPPAEEEAGPEAAKEGGRSEGA
ncbi:OOP family OmpA-OmpF porin [Altererythrobacter atlanticus]|uniref:Photosystem I P700 chlorophyll a apoprotein A2 n=1 Tax=Croceibacterium atlanticum TaxID=1267766 RepID=A0A0F7KW59_9SPHN|nr:OmpA family protein [Croceibacterium atlanticum]AKH43427.1 Photosystem I P700 chlorophyll a apoprotein A2 [Croceibacterium atlanticum]MBB5731865.1 OOP family OmpA-OmpF porin [Croceibacterium atlanticum]